MATVRENIKNALNWFYDRLKDKYLDPFNERITTNTNNIATNTADIATNTANIATNTANIEKNATDISQLNSDLSAKAPTSHASSGTTYGVGTTSNYGHCRTINNLTTSSHTDGYALSAYQGYLLNSSIAYSRGTGTFASNISSVNTNYYYKFGRVCSVYFVVTVGSSDISSDAVTIATGYPNAAGDQHGFGRMTGGGLAILRITTSGEIITAYGDSFPAGSNLRVGFTYITAS